MASDKYEGAVLIFSQDAGDGMHTVNVQRLVTGEVEVRLFKQSEKYTGYTQHGLGIPETLWGTVCKVQANGKAVKQAKVTSEKPKPQPKVTQAAQIAALAEQVAALTAALAAK